MYSWIKKHKSLLITVLVCIGMGLYLYGCESKTKSIIYTDKKINRQELQLELDQIITMGQIRLTDLDQQDRFKAIILQNALILVQGQPLNPVGILTGIAAIYGLTQGSSNITKVVKDKRKKKKDNNG